MVWWGEIFFGIEHVSSYFYFCVFVERQTSAPLPWDLQLTLFGNWLGGRISRDIVGKVELKSIKISLQNQVFWLPLWYRVYRSWWGNNFGGRACFFLFLFLCFCRKANICSSSLRLAVPYLGIGWEG